MANIAMEAMVHLWMVYLSIAWVDFPVRYVSHNQRVI